MNPIKIKNLQDGENAEQELLPKLKLYFKKDIKKTKSFVCYDFKADNLRIELKSRNNTSTKYSTTMIGMNKIKNAQIFNGEYYFFFKFTDKIMFWKYDSLEASCFETKKMGRKDRGCIEEKDYLLIPTVLLTEFIC